LNVSYCKKVETSVVLRVGATFTANYLNSLVITTITATVVTCTYGGVLRFGGAVQCWAYLLISYWGRANALSTINVITDTLARAGLTLTGTELVCQSTLTLTGFAGLNTGLGIAMTSGAKLKTGGATNTIQGFATAISCLTNSEIDFNATSHVLNKGTNTAATALGIVTDTTSSIIHRLRSSITRTNVTDTIDPLANVLDYKKLSVNNLLGFQ
jgi:hypothetical protein